MQDFGYCCWPDRVAQISIGLVDESITQGHGGKKLKPEEVREMRRKWP